MPCPRSPGELAAERHSKARHPKSHRRLRLRVMLRNPWPRGCCHARRRQNPEVTAQGQAGSREGECFGWARQTSQPTSVRGKDQQVGARPRGLVVGGLRQVACVLRKAPILAKDGDPTSFLSTVNGLLERSISFEGGKLLLPAMHFRRACYTEEEEEDQLHLLLQGSRHFPAHARPMDTHRTKMPVNSRTFHPRNPSSHAVSQHRWGHG